MKTRPLASNNPFNTDSAKWDRKMLPFSMVSAAFPTPTPVWVGDGPPRFSVIRAADCYSSVGRTTSPRACASVFSYAP